MIRNKTRKKILAGKETYCITPAEKAAGLMLAKEPKDQGMIFTFNREGKRELHMFFVFFPIDVLFLDKNKRVVEIKEQFMPFTMYTSKKGAQYFIELPKGTVKKTGTRTGDKIEFGN